LLLTEVNCTRVAPIRMQREAKRRRGQSRAQQRGQSRIGRVRQEKSATTENGANLACPSSSWPAARGSRCPCPTGAPRTSPSSGASSRRGTRRCAGRGGTPAARPSAPASASASRVRCWNRPWLRRSCGAWPLQRLGRTSRWGGALVVRQRWQAEVALKTPQYRAEEVRRRN
jgi:hypothetical protein